MLNNGHFSFLTRLSRKQIILTWNSALCSFNRTHQIKLSTILLILTWHVIWFTSLFNFIQFLSHGWQVFFRLHPTLSFAHPWSYFRFAEGMLLAARRRSWSCFACIGSLWVCMFYCFFNTWKYFAALFYFRLFEGSLSSLLLKNGSWRYSCLNSLGFWIK